MGQTPSTYQAYAERTALQFLDALRALPEFKPRPGVDLGLIRISVTVVDSGVDHSFVDIDPVNLEDLAAMTARRAEGLRAKHARLAARPSLRLIGGGQ